MLARQRVLGAQGARRFGQLSRTDTSRPLRQAFDRLPLYNSFDLAQLAAPCPPNTKMLTRDFIHDSLYNKHYGYFSHSTPLRLHTNIITREFGYAMARYLLLTYKLNFYPYHDLVVYDIGSELQEDLRRYIMEYLQRYQPDVHSKTRYYCLRPHIASQRRTQAGQSSAHSGGSLARDTAGSAYSATSSAQAGARLGGSSAHSGGNPAQARGSSGSPAQAGFSAHSGGMGSRYSIFDWDKFIPEPCFVLGFGVLNNLTHDCVKYDIHTDQPLQSYMVVNERRELVEVFHSELDELTKVILGMKHARVSERSLRNRLRNMLNPGLNNLSQNYEFLPIESLKLFSILSRYFPKHQLVLGDFNKFAVSLPGYQTPLIVDSQHEPVRNRFDLQPGEINFKFPTNFHDLNLNYMQVCNKLNKSVQLADFMRDWTDDTDDLPQLDANYELLLS